MTKKRKITTHCKNCGIELEPLNSIYVGINRLAYCRSCWNNRQRSLDSKEKRRNKRLKTKFNITNEEYNELLILHQGGCAICKQPCRVRENLGIDHNHKTGRIRGLLCHNCNSALGLLHEDEDLIWNMLEYLKRENKNVSFDTNSY